MDREQNRESLGIEEQGFLLLGLIVAIALILLTLSIAAPDIGRNLRRDREVEAVRRGNQYVRGIQMYYRKLNHYPGSLEQLEKTNNVRYLRQRYLNPITGKADWRTIPVGQNKTTVKGFFGEPLAGIASTGLGSAAGLASPGIGAGATSGTGAVTGAGFGSSGAAGTFGASNGAGGTGATGTSGTGSAPGSTAGSTGPGTTTAGATSGSIATGGSSGIGSQPATSFSGTAGAFMGMGLGAGGESIIELNEQTNYATWEFLYDPRIDQLKAKAAGLNGGIGAAPAGGLGQTPGAFGTTPATGAPVTGAPGTSTTGAPSPPTVGVPNQP